MEGDLAVFHEKVKNAFVAVGQAVHEELARQEGSGPADGADAAAADPAPSEPPPAAGDGPNGQRSGNGHPVSQKQMAYAVRAWPARSRGWACGGWKRSPNGSAANPWLL